MAAAKPGCPAAAAVAWALVSCAVTVEGGLKTRSSSGGGASESPRRLTGGDEIEIERIGPQTRLSGLDYVMSGYDIFFGNPRPSKGAVDTGFRNRIFKDAYSGGASFHDNRGTPLPDGITTLPCDGSCSFDSTVQSLETLGEYYDFLRTNVYVNLKYGEIAGFSASADFQRIEEGMVRDESVYTIVEARCCAYKAFIQTFTPPPIDNNFLAAVTMAPEEYDQSFYFDLIGEFGTHFVATAQMGGVYGEETQFTGQEYKDVLSVESQWSSAAKASFLVSIETGAETEADWELSDWFHQQSTKTMKYSLGSMPPHAADEMAWHLDTLENAVPTSMKLKPLSELFTTSIFPNDPNSSGANLQAKRDNMERALQEYCSEKLLKEGWVESCEKIIEDPEETAAEETCLAKVWGGGGPGGQPFDDSASMVELHGLSKNLQVEKIEYRSDLWLDSIQLVLAQGDTSWALPEHGGTTGDPGTLTVWAGQKITAVEMRYDNYIDRVTFWTNDGTAHVVGGSGGAHEKMVNFQDAIRTATGYLPNSAWLVGLYGSSERYVDSLGFYVAYTCSPSDVPGPAGVVSP
jgi:hypothetical protein